MEELVLWTSLMRMPQCIIITLLPPPPPKKETNKQKKISVFKNGIIECATVSHSAGLFGFLEILFWLYLDPLCLSWILRQAFYGAFGFFKDRKCGGVPKVPRLYIGGLFICYLRLLFTFTFFLFFFFFFFSQRQRRYWCVLTWKQHYGK